MHVAWYQSKHILRSGWHYITSWPFGRCGSLIVHACKCLYELLVHCVCTADIQNTYSVLMNVSSCLYTVSIRIYAVNNHIILKFRISTSKSALESGNLAEIFIEILKSCITFLEFWNLTCNLEISPEIRKSSAKSQDFEISYRIFSSDQPLVSLVSMFISPVTDKALQFSPIIPGSEFSHRGGLLGWFTQFRNERQKYTWRHRSNKRCSYLGLPLEVHDAMGEALLARARAQQPLPF